MASAGPYASLHLAPDRQPHQHPTALFFTGRMPFLPPNQQCQSTEGKRCGSVNWQHISSSCCWCWWSSGFAGEWEADPALQSAWLGTVSASDVCSLEPLCLILKYAHLCKYSSICETHTFRFLSAPCHMTDHKRAHRSFLCFLLFCFSCWPVHFSVTSEKFETLQRMQLKFIFMCPLLVVPVVILGVQLVYCVICLVVWSSILCRFGSRPQGGCRVHTWNSFTGGLQLINC